MKDLLTILIVLFLLCLGGCGKPDTSECAENLSEETCLYYLQ